MDILGLCVHVTGAWVTAGPAVIILFVYFVFFSRRVTLMVVDMRSSDDVIIV